MGACTSINSKRKRSDSTQNIQYDSEHALLDRFGSAQIEMLRAKGVRVLGC